MLATGKRWMCAAHAGQATVEYALIGIIMVVLSMVAMQYGLLAVQQFGAGHVARTTARWLAVNIDKTDSQTMTYARGIGDSLPGVGTTGMTAVATSPACGALTGGKCAGRETGDPITVTVTVNQSSMIFLPTTVSIGSLRVDFPTGSKTSRASVMLE